MGLSLLPKKSILDTIGSALSTAGNAAVSGVKDIGDLASEGLGDITGNSMAANNAANAIKQNDRNLSGGNLPRNLGGLSSDVGATQMVRSPLAIGAGLGLDIGNAMTGQNLTPEEYSEQQNNPLGSIVKFASNRGKNNIGNPRQLVGNAIETGVNLATLGKGSALEQGTEDVVKNALGENALAKAGARVAGGIVTGGAYGAGRAGGPKSRTGSRDNRPQRSPERGLRRYYRRCYGDSGPSQGS